MENYKNKINNLPRGKKVPVNWKNVWVLIAILLLLVVIISVVYSIIYKSYITVDNISTTNTNIPNFHNSDGLPREIYAYSGNLIEKNNNTLKIAVKKNNNYTLLDKEVTVIIDDQTKFRKFIAPKSIPELKPGETGSYYKRIDITLKDIKVDDFITVVANENIKNKTKFTAAIVEVHNK